MDNKELELNTDADEREDYQYSHSFLSYRL